MSDKETFLRNFAKPILFKKAPPMGDRYFHEPAKKAAPVERIESMLNEEQRAELTELRSLHARMLPEWRPRIANFLGRLSPRVLLDLREDGSVGFCVDASPISEALAEYKKGLEMRPDAFGPEVPSP